MKELALWLLVLLCVVIIGWLLWRPQIIRQFIRNDETRTVVAASPVSTVVNSRFIAFSPMYGFSSTLLNPILGLSFGNTNQFTTVDAAAKLCAFVATKSGVLTNFAVYVNLVPGPSDPPPEANITVYKSVPGLPIAGSVATALSVTVPVDGFDHFFANTSTVPIAANERVTIVIEPLPIGSAHDVQINLLNGGFDYNT